MVDHMLLIEERGATCTLALNCPEKRNALNEKLLLQLRGELERLSKKEGIRAIIIRGAGEEAFCSGYDVGALITDTIRGDGRNVGLSKAFAPFDMVVEAISSYPYPVIAMLNGYAFGGGLELAVACDLRVAGDHVRLGMTPAKIGMIYTPQGLMRFIRTIGLSKTREIFFTGRTYDAQAAREMGLVDHVVPSADLERVVRDLAEEIAGNAPLSVKGIKRMLNLILHSQDRLPDATLAEAGEIMAKVLRSRDLQEGRAAFLEKRPPRFVGR